MVLHQVSREWLVGVAPAPERLPGKRQLSAAVAGSTVKLAFVVLVGEWKGLNVVNIAVAVVAVEKEFVELADAGIGDELAVRVAAAVGSVAIEEKAVEDAAVGLDEGLATEVAGAVAGLGVVAGVGSVVVVAVGVVAVGVVAAVAAGAVAVEEVEAE